jgi:hypothetical protein
MKSFLLIIASACLLGPALSLGAEVKVREIVLPEGVDPDMAKEAGNKAIQATLSDFLKQQNVPMKRYAILPLTQDLEGGYFTNQLRNYFSTQGPAKGYELYTRMDDEFKMLLNEIAWGQNYGDTMDPSTVQKFGRLQGVQGLITPKFGGVSSAGEGDAKIRFGMQVFEVETGKLVWGGERAAIGGNMFAHWNTQKSIGVIAAVLLIALFIVWRALKSMRASVKPR